MFLYKRNQGECKLIDYIDSTDTYEIEEYIIKTIRSMRTRECKSAYDFDVKFSGYYTIYDFGGSFVILTSEYLLNKDSSIKSTDPDLSKILPIKKRRNRKKKNQFEADKVQIGKKVKNQTETK